MFEKERSGIDRSSGADRRRVMNVDHWLSEGVERRPWSERRSEFERRADWVGVSQRSSVSARDIRT
ncbi:MAG: hypothetical protein JSV55_07100 [Deltaproteobacteria bacterium]|nr:MAG: hypothetical protein JSV40_07340 [Deltaproteobacteria bacterium]UCH08722.1 MAG: hypothetical protein JSV55_07100 [Deltaproteobacteria bacterium]